MNFGERNLQTLRQRILAAPEGSRMIGSANTKWKMQRLIATPPWANFEKIREVYAEARRCGMTVGHIVPLNHPRVCGLHVHYNLKLEPASLNFSKGNAWCDWHGDLFSEPEQLRLDF